MDEIEAGRVIGRRYELVRLLGRGAMGQVWAAYHQSLNERVAIKLLARSPLFSEGEHYATCVARFQFEAQIAARLSRKTRHIVRVTDHGEDSDDLAYLVMELLEGQTLEQRLALLGPMQLTATSRMVAQIARALEEAHAESIIHRDLKPANVFLTLDEDAASVVKLLDFGIARAMRTQRVARKFVTGEGLVFGTPGYMSPEQACGSKVDARCDLWALATVAYEALTCDLPVPGACTGELIRNLYTCRFVPIHERRPNLPLALKAFFERAFAPRLEARFVSASQLSQAFERAVSVESSEAPRHTDRPAPNTSATRSTGGLFRPGRPESEREHVRDDGYALVAAQAPVATSPAALREDAAPAFSDTDRNNETSIAPHAFDAGPMAIALHCLTNPPASGSSQTSTKPRGNVGFGVVLLAFAVGIVAAGATLVGTHSRAVASMSPQTAELPTARTENTSPQAAELPTARTESASPAPNGQARPQPAPSASGPMGTSGLLGPVPALRAGSSSSHTQPPSAVTPVRPATKPIDRSAIF